MRVGNLDFTLFHFPVIIVILLVYLFPFFSVALLLSMRSPALKSP